MANVRTKGYGARSILYATAVLWNDLFDKKNGDMLITYFVASLFGMDNLLVYFTRYHCN